MKRLVFPTVVILGLVFCACEKDMPGDVEYRDQEMIELKGAFAEDGHIESSTASLTGIVCFAGSKIPVPGATITISEETANSCEEGLFCFDNIPLGTHSLVACKDDFESCAEEVVVNKESKDIVIYMTSRQFSTKISGNVTGDYTGNAMSHLQVIVLNPDGSESKLKTVTAFDGRYSVDAVPMGERTLVVRINDEVIFEQDVNLNDSEEELDISVEETLDFIDYRDGRKYKAIRIGSQTWMAENLAYRHYPQVTGDGILEDAIATTSNLHGLDSEEASPVRDARKYGHLYTWDEARKACPQGWHLPRDKEWKVLEKNLGMSTMEADSRGRRESDAEGFKVKSTGDWMDGGDGDNQSGFNVLPAGMSRYGKEIRLGSHAYFWTSTQLNSTKAWFRDVYFAKSGINRLYYNKNAGYSVRCVKDVARFSTPATNGIK